MVNSQYFSKEQIEAGEMAKLLDFLMNEAYGAGTHYNDIHIKPEDCEAFIVEWEQVPWDHSFGGRFAYLNEDEVIMKEIRFPDGTYEHVIPEYANEVMTDWLREHPYWKKNKFGNWIDVHENRICYIDFNRHDLIGKTINDTFDLFIPGLSHEDIIMNLLHINDSEGLLNRTDYLIIGKKLKEYFDFCKCSLDCTHLCDLEQYMYNTSEEDDRIISVYVLDDLVDEVCFMSDYNGVIYKVKCKGDTWVNLNHPETQKTKQRKLENNTYENI